MRNATIAGAVLLAILICAGVAIYVSRNQPAEFIPIGSSAEQIAANIRSWGHWAVVGSLSLMVAHSFVPLPAEIIAIANGMVFGAVVGSIITWTGAMLGAICAFAVARWLGRWFVEAVLPARSTAALDDWTRENGTPVLLISRFLPVVSFNLINYAAGLTSVSWWTFLWTTGLGIAPLTFLMVWAGEQMISGRWELALLVSAACAALVLLGYVITRGRKSRMAMITNRSNARADELSILERYERIAPFYDLLDLPFEYGRYRKIRPLLFEGLSGRLLDAGVGTGRNFQFYPPTAKVIGIDLSPAMLIRAEKRRGLAIASVELRQMDVTRLDFPDRYFDGAVATFLFCTLPDQLQVPALKELSRVVKIGGLIRLLEYTRPSGAVRHAITKIWEPWVYWAYGAGFDRRTEEHVPEAGLKLVSSQFVSADIIKMITAGPLPQSD